MESKPNILLIEKEEDEINKLKTILGGISNLDIIGTTTEAVTILNENKEKYSLIIVALNMPVLNGYLFCLTLKKDIKIRDVPIIITGTLVEFTKTEITDGLRIGDYDKIIRPYENKLVVDLVDISLEKKKMLERLNELGRLDENDTLHSVEYFKEMLDLELLKASKLETTLNCLSIKTSNDDVRENLLSLIKNACRHSDLACEFNDRILLLLPRTADQEGLMICNRFNSVIYGLHIDRLFYDPTRMDTNYFKSELWGSSLYSL